jgi:hypothetical protein
VKVNIKKALPAAAVAVALWAYGGSYTPRAPQLDVHVEQPMTVYEHHAMFPAPFGFLGSGAKVLFVTTSTANLNLYTFATANGFVAGSVVITINAGVDCYSTSTGVPAVVSGGFHSGDKVTLIIKGTISGCGGAGGSGYVISVSAPSPGSAGGPALSVSAVSGLVFKVDNGSGTIRGGGGGGAGGSGGGPYVVGYHSNGCPCYPACVPCYAYSSGSGGGGGQGHNGGGGGASGGTDGANGGAGSSSAPGSGGTSGLSGFSGGNGGSWGAAGGGHSGATGCAFFDGVNSPGAGGNAVNGNANITWLANGTRTGAIT